METEERPAAQLQAGNWFVGASQSWGGKTRGPLSPVQVTLRHQGRVQLLPQTPLWREQKTLLIRVDGNRKWAESTERSREAADAHTSELRSISSAAAAADGSRSRRHTCSSRAAHLQAMASSSETLVETSGACRLTPPPPPTHTYIRGGGR